MLPPSDEVIIMQINFSSRPEQWMFRAEKPSHEEKWKFKSKFMNKKKFFVVLIFFCETKLTNVHAGNANWWLSVLSAKIVGKKKKRNYFNIFSMAIIWGRVEICMSLQQGWWKYFCIRDILWVLIYPPALLNNHHRFCCNHIIARENIRESKLRLLFLNNVIIIIMSFREKVKNFFHYWRKARTRLLSSLCFCRRFEFFTGIFSKLAALINLAKSILLRDFIGAHRAYWIVNEIRSSELFHCKKSLSCIKAKSPGRKPV